MRVILAYKNFAANKHVSHIGLGVAALNTCKVLKSHGIDAEVWPIVDGNQLRQRLRMAEGKYITHVVISAPWIPAHGISQLCSLFPLTKFAVNCHSNVGFLQADHNGVRLLRHYLDLEMAVPNFHVSANSQRMAHWIRDAYGNPCEVLPNMYFLDKGERITRNWQSGANLRIGVFGAVRPQKNFVSAVGAAIELSYQLNSNVEIWISTGRLEGGGGTILKAAMEMCARLPLVTIKEAGWQTWPEFRRLVGSMSILLQPSYTESFNMVTADGIAEGVPTVVSDAIDWVPLYWRARADDVFDIARVARHLLSDPLSRRDGMRALVLHNVDSLQHWKDFLG